MRLIQAMGESWGVALRRTPNHEFVHSLHQIGYGLNSEALHAPETTTHLTVSPGKYRDLRV